MATKFDELREVLVDMHNIARFWQEKAEKLDAEVAQLESRKTKLEELQRQLSAENKQLRQGIENQFNTLNQTLKGLTSKQVEMKEQFKEELLEEIRGGDDKTNLRELRGAINLMNVTLKPVQELVKVEQKQAELLKKEKELDAEKAGLDDLNRELEQTKKHNAELSGEVEVLRQAKDELQNKLKALPQVQPVRVEGLDIENFIDALNRRFSIDSEYFVKDYLNKTSLKVETDTRSEKPKKIVYYAK